jgi:sortase (surface protein transpeptidase)
MSEVIIYSYLYSKKSGTLDISPRPVKTSISAIFLGLSKASALIGIALILFFYAPGVLAWGQSLIGGAPASSKTFNNVQRPVFEPPLDLTLPTANWISVPSIGVNTEIQEASVNDYESALKKGVWRVTDFGTPDLSDGPIILAAHRFGYLDWTDLYRHENSFYNLPKVMVGDVIEIDWKQRKYTYKIYATDKGTQITDYSADLILYTCETLVGPERIFVYAHLVQV